MAIDKIKRNFVWLRKVLRITEKTTLPGQILGEIRPALDTFGWDLPPIQFVSQSTPGVTTATILPVVPEDEAHLFFACDIFHDDPVGSKDIAILYRKGTIEEVGVQGTVDNVVEKFLVTLPRPMLVQAGSSLMGRATSSIAAGSDFIIRGLFVRLKPGEYLAASPFG